VEPWILFSANTFVREPVLQGSGQIFASIVAKNAGTVHHPEICHSQQAESLQYAPQGPYEDIIKTVPTLQKRFCRLLGQEMRNGITSQVRSANIVDVLRGSTLAA
jgi:hypothetical protein